MATSSRALLVAFFAVVAAFIGSTILAQRAAQTIDEEAVFISRDAAPGIATLSDLRAELRSLEAGVASAVETRDPSGVTQSRARIDRLMAQALALPNTRFEVER